MGDSRVRTSVTAPAASRPGKGAPAARAATRPAASPAAAQEPAAAEPEPTTSPIGFAFRRVNVLQRRIDTPIREHPQTGSRVCLVHVHGNEENALRVAQDIRRDYCASLVYLDNPGSRCVSFQYDNPTAGASTVDPCATPAGAMPPARCTALADPNRIYSADDNVTKRAPYTGECVPPPPASHRAAEGRGTPFAQVVEFRGRLLAAIDSCRRAGGGSPAPIVAFHNNTEHALDVNWYATGSSHDAEREGAERRPGPLTPPPRSGRPRPTPVPNPSLSTVTPDPHNLRDPDNFMLATRPEDFHGLRGRHNIALQRPDIAPGSTADDGSMSVHFRNDRYINLEAQEKRFVRRENPFFITNRVMADAVMAQLGVPRGPCGTTQTGPPQTLPTRPVHGVGLTRAGAPSNSVLPGVTRFANLRQLNNTRDAWLRLIGAMPQADVLAWIVGRIMPSPAIDHEVTMQRDAMLAQLRADARTDRGLRAGSVQSGYRSFTDQLDIWERKFRFDRSVGAFDRITPAAISACSSLPANSRLRANEREQPWQTAGPDRDRHFNCWRTLSSDLRQQQILQASSAPGISRHHWGTEVDLFSVTPRQWEAGQRFEHTYEWLAGAAGGTGAGGHAITFGFNQSYSRTHTGPGPVPPRQRGPGGYMEERWHWSYYPIAAALQGYAVARRTELGNLLRTLWYGRDDFSHIQANWEIFVTNVQDVSTSNLLPP